MHLAIHTQAINEICNRTTEYLDYMELGETSFKELQQNGPSNLPNVLMNAVGSCGPGFPTVLMAILSTG